MSVIVLIETVQVVHLPVVVVDSFLSRSASGCSKDSTSDSGRQFSQ